ncbi:YgiQ family radical SAM protein [Geobacter sp. SVR]|uniref:YgiQ family radical SAM protein n=1 Tax=Geobacter sp. SVR TaxID=2495594 RepID=UPI0015634BA8|nr:YgiQ family radical SAM protein [Geobacter sp. SVR]
MTFIPTTRAEVVQRGWSELDVVFVSGDAYIDHPAFGVPLLARWLEAHGFRVGILAQPDWRSKEAFMSLGRPRLFFAVSAGAMDSMVAHYTPARKLRHDDAYTPGNRHGARPNRATIIYTSRLKEAYRDVPVVIGGIEASLRRFVHYDYWENKVRRSLLFDAKADLLIYGMAERPLLELAQRMQDGERMADIRDLRGTCRIMGNLPHSGPLLEDEKNPPLEIPSFEEVSSDKSKFAEAFRLAAREQNPFCARPLIQYHGQRVLVCNPPALPLSEREMDAIYALPFVKSPHPGYREPIPAWEQIKTSVTSHRGCFGGCAFCSIAMHQGKLIQSRSQGSVLAEVDALAAKPWFRGSISDIGGPTANMYGLACGNEQAGRSCRRPSCLFPQPCAHLTTSDRRAVSLLRAARARRGIRHVAVSSGVRYDLMERQSEYFGELIGQHVSGLLKVAPEHLVEHVTQLMRKPGKKSFERFLKRFREENSRLGRRQAIVPYLISGHPGCRLEDMLELALTLRELGLRVEQVQDFTPTPGTLATCMYHTGIDPDSGQAVYVARSDREKGLQKSLLLWHVSDERRRVQEALRELGREDLGEVLSPGGRPQHSPHARTPAAGKVTERGPRKAPPVRGRNGHKKTR